SRIPVSRCPNRLPARGAPCSEPHGKGRSESNRDRIFKSALRFFVCDRASGQSSRGQRGDSMVKIVAVVLFVLLCAIPVMAQEDYPRVRISFGYAYLGF